MSKKKLNIGLLGLGTVGAGTVSVLQRNAALIAERAGCELAITHAVVKDIHKARACPLQGIHLSTEPDTVLENPEIDIVVELIGGETIAKEYIETAMRNGKHIVTANKSLLAHCGGYLVELAEECEVRFAFEAAVAGGVPIIKTLTDSLTANRILSILGILNGTCNYILTQMSQRGSEFAVALKEAQTLGYAEADPTLDVEGFDVAHKLAVLASVAFATPFDTDDIYREGISNITATDIQYAKQLGFVIKHLGIAESTEEGFILRVHPALIPERSILAHINGPMNAVMVAGDAVGNTFYAGPGAGAEATASAVISDLIDIARHIDLPIVQKHPKGLNENHLIAIRPINQVKCAYYIRMNALDKAGVLAEATYILGKHGISIEALIQQEPVHENGLVPVIILTHPVQEEVVDEATTEIEALSGIGSRVTRIRVVHMEVNK